MRNTFIDVQEALTISELLPCLAALDRLLADLVEFTGIAADPDEEPTDDGDRWDGLS